MLLGGGCSFDTEFSCEDDGQCALRSGGRCELDGWCSYPSGACESGHVYGPYAPPGVADVCVVPENTGTGSQTGGGTSSGTGTGTSSSTDESDGGSSTTGTPEPAAVCGNGIVEEGESCDDGNTARGDSCHPLCVDLYEAVWTQEYNGTDRDDRGFAVDVDVERDAVYVVGLTELTDTSDKDLLVHRFGLSDGAPGWSWSRDAAGGDDRAEQVAVDMVGDVVVGGHETDEGGVEHAWLAKLSPDGQLIWELRDSMGSKAEGVAIADDGRIVAVGRLGELGDSVAWHQWYGPDGIPDGAPVLSGMEPASDTRGIDVVNVPGVGIQITGVLHDGAPNLWTARFDGAGTLLAEHRVPDPNGDAPRGVGQALSPLGGTAIGGVRNTDRFVLFYDDDLVPAHEPWEEGDPGQDEVADVAFLDDGRYVLVGFIGFNLQETGTADGWIRFNEPDGTLIEQRPISGNGGGLDKLLAVENAPDSVIVTGYVKNETTGFDLWLRRFAI